MLTITTDKNTNNNRIFNTLRRIIISGSDNAVTDIIKDNTEPKAAPFDNKTFTIGIIPAAFE